MQRSRESEVTVSGVDMRLKPKCIICGNTRTFFVTVRDQTSLWNTMEAMPRGARVAACGRCRSRRSVILDYSD